MLSPTLDIALVGLIPNLVPMLNVWVKTKTYLANANAMVEIPCVRACCERLQNKYTPMT